MVSDGSRTLSEWLPKLLTLLAGEREARAIARRVTEAAGPDATPESCPAPLLADGFAQAMRQAGRAGGLSPDQRLALLLAKAGGLSEERAAEIAGLPVSAFRDRRASAEAALAQSTTARAVILEDHGLTRESLVEMSHSSGIEVVAATDRGAVAVAAAAAFAPAIAVIDIDLHGAELAGDLAAMQIREVAPACHVLFVTGYPEANRIAEVMQNASALIKPFRPAEFSSAVRAAL